MTDMSFENKAHTLHPAGAQQMLCDGLRLLESGTKVILILENKHVAVSCAPSLGAWGRAATPQKCSEASASGLVLRRALAGSAEGGSWVPRPTPTRLRWSRPSLPTLSSA